MSTPRNTTVDFMRGFAILLIILIHVTYYFRDNGLANLLWEYSQVAVPIFVFCSAYVFFNRKNDDTMSFSYLYKRIKRLLLPYYGFLFVFFFYAFVIKKVPFSVQSVLEKVFLTNARSMDVEWLVVLFIYFIFLMPIIVFLSKKPAFLWIFAVVSFASAVFFLFTPSHMPFRFTLWLPWTLVLIITYLIVKNEKTRWFLPSVILIFAGLYLISRGLLIDLDRSLVLRNNKYPPNLYYLSYGIFLMLLIYAGYAKLPFKEIIVQKWFNFLSKYSYSIFFIHFLILYYFIDFTLYKNFQWWGLFGIVLTLTIMVQMTLTKAHYFFSMLKKAN